MLDTYRDRLRAGLLKYTRRAFGMLPRLAQPRILDIGCGSGIPTMELARLSKGKIIGLDINQPLLDRLKARIDRAGMAGRVETMRCSMFDMPFLDESFDIIWSEGSIFVLGFERGLKEWRRLLKTGGFLVVHEMTWARPDPPQKIFNYWKGYYPGMKTVPECLERIRDGGYHTIGHFTLPEDTWWIEYYGPLEKCIKDLRAKYAGDPAATAIFDREQREIDISKKYHRWYGSTFFLMQKR